MTLPTEVDQSFLVDGFNVPLTITNSADCPLSNCPFDLLLNCPDDLKKKNAAGDTIGCLTDCGATNNDAYCCAGDHNLPATCPSSDIPNYKWWKSNCPIAYAYAYDESSGTALFTCTKGVDYFITFCPSDDLYDDTAVLPDGSTISQGSGTPASTVAVGETGAVTGGGGGDATKTAAASGGGAAPSATGGKSDGSTTLAAGSAGATTGPSNSASIGASKTVGGGAAGVPTATTSPDSGTGSGGSATTRAGSAGASAPATSSSGSNSTLGSDGATIFGMSQTVLIGIAGSVLFMIVLGIACALHSRKEKHGDHRRGQDDDTSDEDGGSGSSDTDTGSSADNGEDEKRRR